MSRFCTTLILSAALCAAPAYAKLYKWTDENGQVHYTDKIPEQYLRSQREELNEQGSTVKHIERALTEEEKAQRRQQEEARKEQERVRQEQARRDRILTDTYTTERDLIAAKNARLEAIDSQINLSESFIKDSAQKIEKTEKYIEQWKAQGKVVPDATYQKLERDRAQLDTQKAAMEKHRQTRAEIVEQFDGYIARFRELMAAREKSRQASKD